MAEVWGGILRGIGTALGAIYDVIPSYGLAIIILTIGVRVILIPLTIRQIRSMTAMQTLQPQLKELQKKHKVDRLKMDPETIRERRAKLQEETMKLYREHGVNPLGGCFPLLMQAPVFIALYSVLRAAVPAAAVPVNAAEVKPPPKTAVCTPGTTPSVSGPTPTSVVCVGEDGEEQTYQIASWQVDKDTEPETPPTFLSICRPGFTGEEGAKRELRFACSSPIGTGHLPKGSDLFADIVEDRSRFLGLELACSPTQAGSDQGIRQCTAGKREAGGAPLVGYYALVLLMAGSTYYQQRQVQQRAGAEPTQQMKMMGRIMPLFLGFVSLNIPAGVIIYWVASNGWTIGQQTIFFRKGPPAPAPAKESSSGAGPGGGFLKGLRGLTGGKPTPEPEPPAAKPHRPGPPSRSKKKKKKRR